MRLENWAIVTTSDWPSEMGDVLPTQIKGRIYEDIRYPNGTEIITAPLGTINPILKTITTINEVTYELGKVDPLYVKAFPNAASRFWEGNDDIIKTNITLL